MAVVNTATAITDTTMLVAVTASSSFYNNLQNR
jgi:hypothetical protein